ncbi:hypothetical protein QE152_g24956 [Popillia japonica]|uniref:Uncharacterized protein n=1 Tax=Popillia japonica TaxID=7064 RepID=A0AAW1K2J1_POPJA
MDFKATLRKKLVVLNSKPVASGVKEDEYFQQYLNEINKKSVTGKCRSIPPVASGVKEDEYFQQYLNEINKKSVTGKCRSIPRFFWRLPREDELLKQKLREETRSNFLQRRSRQQKMKPASQPALMPP